MPDMDGDMADMDDDMADMDGDEDEAYVQDDGEKRMPLSKPALGVRIAETFGLQMVSS
jgi:hypothetical protein